MNTMESLYVDIPLDSDGYLRRECPECARQFKIEIADEDESRSVDRLHCPYCGRSALLDQWFTEEQVQYFRDRVVSDVVNPALRGFTEQLQRASRASEGLIGFEVKSEGLDEPPPRRLREEDDMVRVRFSCCEETVKVSPDWGRELHCVVCGTTDTDVREEE